MGLELLAISLGLCTFEALLADRKVVVHCDNTGSEAAVRRGSAVRWDHAQLVHEQWMHAADQGLSLHVVRVGTHDSIADLPSRNELALLKRVGGIQLEPVIRERYWQDGTWDVLQERWRL